MLKALNQVGGILFHYLVGQIERTVRGVVALGEGKAWAMARAFDNASETCSGAGCING